MINRSEWSKMEDFKKRKGVVVKKIILENYCATDPTVEFLSLHPWGLMAISDFPSSFFTSIAMISSFNYKDQKLQL